MMEKKGRFLPNDYFITVALILLIVFTYSDLTKLYYLNDEWIQFGLVKVHGIFAGINRWPLQEILLGNGRILGTFINNLIYYYFPYNILPFAAVSWVMHLANCYLVYLIAKKISKNIFVSAVASLFFSVSQISYQAFSWPAASIQVIESAFFMFGGIYLFICYLDRKLMRYFLFSVISIYISTLFKSNALIMAVFLPLLILVYTDKSTLLLKWVRKYRIAVSGVTALFLGCIFLLIVFSPDVLRRLFAGHLAYRYELSVWNSIFYPIVSLSHFFVPFRYMYRLADIFAGFFYPFISSSQFISQRDILLNFIVPDMLSLLLFIPITAGLLYCYISERKLRKTYIFAFIYYIVVFVPFAIYLDHRNTSYIESRYMYAQSLGIGLFIGGLFQVLKDKITTVSKNKSLSWLCVLPVLILFLFKQASVVKREILVSAYESADIKYITKEIKKTFPVLPKNPVIYLDGNSFYYSYPNMKVPLQIGPGYVFFVLYYDQIGSPELFDKNDMLWQLSVEWYEEADGKGYGYFYNKENLKIFVQKNKHISPEQLVGIYYNGNTKKFEDRTAEIRKYIFNEERIVNY